MVVNSPLLYRTDQEESATSLREPGCPAGGSIDPNANRQSHFNSGHTDSTALRQRVDAPNKCCVRSEIRSLVRELDGLKCLISQLLQVQAAKSRDEKQLLEAVTSAIWKCSENDPQNVAIFHQHKVVSHLTNVLLCHQQHTEVCRNVVGGLAECVTNSQHMSTLILNKAIGPLIGLLISTDEQLLINVCKLLDRCCANKTIMTCIEEEDGIRHLWSLLKNNNPEVQRWAGQAIYSCIIQSPHITEMVRNFVGGLELLVDLLSSPHVQVLTSACGVMSAVATSNDNLAIIIDNGAVNKLSSLTTNEMSMRNAELQRYLADAIANCCTIGGEINVRSFGENKAIAPLVSWMKSEDEQVRNTSVKALAVLSTDTRNCLEMHQHDAVKVKQLAN
ncbi:Armadillo repeat-containing protein 4 [Chamberlinius hualienensis]